MADDVEDLAKIVLGETSGLSGDGASAAASQARLWAVVAFIAQLARGHGLLGQMRRAGNSVPADEAANYLGMRSTAEKIIQDKYDGPTPLPKQAVLWELTADGYPLLQPRKPPAWIFAGGVGQGLDFKDRNGVRYRLYETDDAPQPGEAGFASAYTLSGMVAPAWNVPPGLRKAAWVIGTISALLFLVGGVSAVWSGQSDGVARADVKNLDTQYLIVDKLADNCIAAQSLFPNLKPVICSFLADANGKYVKPAAPPAAATQPAAAPPSSVIPYDAKVGQAITTIRDCLGLPAAPEVGTPPTRTSSDTVTVSEQAGSCEFVARSAAATGLAAIAPSRSFLDGIVNSIMGLRNVPGTRSIIVQLLALTLGIAGLAIALGLGAKGRIAGIWIDERNRVSLARAQVTLWTIVALGGFAAIALFNVGLGGSTAFPQIPASIAAALGIAFASPMISALILNTKDFGTKGSASDSILRVGKLAPGDKDFSNRGGSLEMASAGPLEIRANPSEASLADVFVGELVSEANEVDISRLQNVVLTATLVLGYLAMLVDQLRSIPAESLLSGLPSLPDPGGAFTSVLLVSHATYLGTKAYKGRSNTQDNV
jgi:hypothetical protein